MCDGRRTMLCKEVENKCDLLQIGARKEETASWGKGFENYL